MSTELTIHDEDEREEIVRQQHEAANALARKRAALLKEMTPKLREVATSYETKEAENVLRYVLQQFSTGIRIKEVLQHPEIYGASGVRQLAAYWGRSENELGQLKNMAEQLDQKWITRELSILKSDGTSLELGHLLQVTQLSSESERLKQLKRSRTHNWSITQLAEELRAVQEKRNNRKGGRLPSPPTSPQAGLRKLCVNAQGMLRRAEITKNFIAVPLKSIDAGDVDDKLITNLTEAREALTQLKAFADGFLATLDKVDARVDTIKKANGKQAQTEPKAVAATGKRVAKRA